MTDISLHTNNLHERVQKDIQDSSTIYILSSFMMLSGVNVIFDDLQIALHKGADVKILTCDYLYITVSQALGKLLQLTGDHIEIRLWRSEGISVHPKAYIFKHREDGAIIIGSSNLSRSALTSGVEWNLRMVRNASHNVFDQSIEQFISKIGR